MSAVLPGYVYYINRFKYSDGPTGKKLIVVLCDSPIDNSNVVVVKTTSQTKPNKILGCELYNDPPIF